MTGAEQYAVLGLVVYAYLSVGLGHAVMNVILEHLEDDEDPGQEWFSTSMMWMACWPFAVGDISRRMVKASDERMER